MAAIGWLHVGKKLEPMSLPRAKPEDDSSVVA